MNHLLRQLAILCFFNGAVLAQDPVKVAPDAYKLEFENEYVKVMRVHYAPHAKIPEHDHTQFGSAYVYLNDSGPVVFKHVGLSYGAVTRQPVKAGSFRLYKGVKETHEVENPGDTPSDFLRVEFKTTPDKNPNTLRGRYFREDYPAGENFQKVQFENEQVRITRLVCASGKQCAVTANAAEPVLFVALSTAQAKMAGTKETQAKLGPGQTRWLAAGKQGQLAGQGQEPAEWLRFDFKTLPLKETGAEKPHAHPHQ